MFEKVSLQVTAEHVFLAQFVRKMHVEVEVVVHHENALVMVDGVPMVEHVITNTSSQYYGMRELVSLQVACDRGWATYKTL